MRRNHKIRSSGGRTECPRTAVFGFSQAERAPTCGTHVPPRPQIRATRHSVIQALGENADEACDRRGRGENTTLPTIKDPAFQGKNLLHQGSQCSMMMIETLSKDRLRNFLFFSKGPFLRLPLLDGPPCINVCLVFQVVHLQVSWQRASRLLN